MKRPAWEGGRPWLSVALLTLNVGALVAVALRPFPDPLANIVVAWALGWCLGTILAERFGFIRGHLAGFEKGIAEGGAIYRRIYGPGKHDPETLEEGNGEARHV